MSQHVQRRRLLFWTALLLFCWGFVCAAIAENVGEDEDVSFADFGKMPYLYVTSPAKGVSYEPGGQLTVSVQGRDVGYYQLTLTVAGETQTYEAAGASCEYVFSFDQPPTQPGVLTVTGYAGDEAAAYLASVTETIQIPSPKEELIEKMIALAYANSKDSRYKFAPAESDSDIGVCKNFVMRLFDTFSKDYRMLEYPELELHMPKNNSKKACAPYDYGIEWRPETASDGSPFEIVEQFKYNDDLTKEENAELARKLIHSIQKGDFLQIVGYYGGGNGPHSMYEIADYDAATDTVRWTDSNMRGTRVNGVRWGYMQFDADATGEWFVEVFNMKKRGATLYRLRDDLYKN